LALKSPRADAHRVVGIAVLERAAAVPLAVGQVRVAQPERVAELVRDEVCGDDAVEEHGRGLRDAGPRAVLLGVDEHDAVELRRVVAGRGSGGQAARAHQRQVAVHWAVERAQPRRDRAGQGHLAVRHAAVERVDLVEDDRLYVAARERLRAPGHQRNEDPLRPQHVTAVGGLRGRNDGQAQSDEGDR
jgi:hypothetical protein